MTTEAIKLSDHFSYGRLLKFTFPSIIMMIFTSIYGVVDGFFVSNFVGKTGFAAVNLIYPFLMMLGALEMEGYTPDDRLSRLLGKFIHFCAPPFALVWNRVAGLFSRLRRNSPEKK